MRLPLLLLALLAPLALSTPTLHPRVRISDLPPPPCNGKLCPDALSARSEPDTLHHLPRYIIPGQPGPTCVPNRPCPDKIKRVEAAGPSYPPCIHGRPCPVGAKRAVETVGPCGGRGGIPCPPIPPAVNERKRIVGPGGERPSCVQGRPCPQ